MLERVAEVFFDDSAEICLGVADGVPSEVVVTDTDSLGEFTVGRREFSLEPSPG